MSTTTEIVLSTAEQEQIEQAAREVPEIVAAARAMTVSTPDEATAATEFLSRIAGKKRNDENARKALVGPLNAHVKFINDQFKATAEPLSEADSIIREKVRGYQAEQERLRREQETELRRVEERQRREAEEQRERAEVAAREAAEREAQAEAARRAERGDELAREMAEMSAIDLAALIKNGDPADIRVAAAHREMEVRRKHRQAQEQAREEAERAEAAAAAERAAQTAPPAQVAAATPLRSDSGSIAVRKRWDFEVTNPEQVPRGYLAVDTKAIREAVRAGEREIPGVRIFQVDDLAVRAR